MVIISVQENRYRYLDSYGQPKGPFWLAQMRVLWKAGQVPFGTDIARVGTEEWLPSDHFPEITGQGSQLSTEGSRRERRLAGKSDPIRLSVWLLLLLLAWGVHRLTQWTPEPEPRVVIKAGGKVAKPKGE